MNGMILTVCNALLCVCIVFLSYNLRRAQARYESMMTRYDALAETLHRQEERQAPAVDPIAEEMARIMSYTGEEGTDGR